MYAKLINIIKKRFPRVTLHNRKPGSKVSFVACNRIYLADESVSTLAHEYVHVCQIDRDGLLRFYFNYAFSRRKRLQTEIEAYTMTLYVSWLMTNKINPLLVLELVRVLSSKTYCKMVSPRLAWHIVYGMVNTVKTELPALVCFEDVQSLFSH